MEGVEAQVENNQQVPVDETVEPKTDALTMSQSELDSLLDKHAAKVVQTERGKWETEVEAKISEAEKLAKMNAAERKEAEEQARIEQLEKREKELNMREYRYVAKSQLEENNLSSDFVDMVISEDAETTKNNISALKTAFDKAVEAKVQESLKGNTPKATQSVDVLDAFSAKLAKYNK